MKDTTRDAWCTPSEYTEAIGKFDLDPCSNARSTVRASRRRSLDDGDDGLDPNWLLSPFVVAAPRTFINPPYSDVLPWIRAYGHTRFCFLLKFDTSTRWFAELYKLTALVCVTRKRIAFDPPPGVPASSNQFPHAFFYRNADDATPSLLRKCVAWRTR
jgi:hypothetical protein